MKSEDDLWSSLMDVLEQFDLLTRVKWSKNDIPSEWEKVLFMPTSGYLEAPRLGPVPCREVEWLEIDSLELKHRGRLVPPQEINRSEALCNALRNANIPFVQMDNVIRLQPER